MADVGKHLRELIGGLAMELATAKALIEQLQAEQQAQEGKAAKESPPHDPQ